MSSQLYRYRSELPLDPNKMQKFQFNNACSVRTIYWKCLLVSQIVRFSLYAIRYMRLYCTRTEEPLFPKSKHYFDFKLDSNENKWLNKISSSLRHVEIKKNTIASMGWGGEKRKWKTRKREPKIREKHTETRSNIKCLKIQKLFALKSNKWNPRESCGYVLFPSRFPSTYENS